PPPPPPPSPAARYLAPGARPRIHPPAAADREAADRAASIRHGHGWPRSLRARAASVQDHVAVRGEAVCDAPAVDAQRHGEADAARPRRLFDRGAQEGDAEAA